MGIVFGITGSKEPMFQLIKTAPYEIRLIQPYFVAEVSTAEEALNDSFSVLAKYIGVFGTPENDKASPMAMTAPVITRPEKMSVVTKKDKMQFVLPFEYTSLDQIPKPTNKRVTLHSVPSRLIAVCKFSGLYNRDTCMKKLQQLHGQLLQDRMLDNKPPPSPHETLINSEQTLKWEVSQFHPPFTIPWYRRNEMAESRSLSRQMHKALLQRQRPDSRHHTRQSFA
ncbi:SOUL hem-binding protein [Ochromonadaceae sp. CCMP2298]|nr:SOUL hem-binding protein [Ochromonadaceae sp. CCMP2298]